VRGLKTEDPADFAFTKSALYNHDY